MTTFRCDCGADVGHTASRECAANIAATVAYMRQMTDGANRSVAYSLTKAAALAAAEITTGNRVLVGGREWDVVIGTQAGTADAARILAVRSPEYAETTYGDVHFVRPGEPHYDRLAAIAAVA